MATEMIRVDSDVIQQALKEKPNYLNKTAFFSQLIAKSIDKQATLKSDPGAFIYSSSNSFEGLRKESEENIKETFLAPISEQFVCHDPKEHEAFLKEQKKLAQKDSPAFQIFWEVYQASPSKAHNQSKSKARTAWKEALKTEKAENLIEAAKRAVKDQARKIGQEIWCAPFPDAHRWLRNESFALWLEDITPEQAEKVIPGVTIL